MPYILCSWLGDEGQVRVRREGLRPAAVQVRTDCLWNKNTFWSLKLKSCPMSHLTHLVNHCGHDCQIVCFGKLQNLPFPFTLSAVEKGGSNTDGRSKNTSSDRMWQNLVSIFFNFSWYKYVFLIELLCRKPVARNTVGSGTVHSQGEQRGVYRGLAAHFAPGPQRRLIWPCHSEYMI